MTLVCAKFDADLSLSIVLKLQAVKQSGPAFLAYPVVASRLPREWLDGMECWGYRSARWTEWTPGGSLDVLSVPNTGFVTIIITTTIIIITGGSGSGGGVFRPQSPSGPSIGLGIIPQPTKNLPWADRIGINSDVNKTKWSFQHMDQRPKIKLAFLSDSDDRLIQIR